jgi:ABC-type multidrug transport system permease subunit
MSLGHIWAISRKEFHHIVRDRSTLILVLFTPTLLLILMAYALSVDIRHVPVGVLDADQSQASQQFIQQIMSGSDLDLAAYVHSEKDLEDLLDRGDIKAAVIIAPGFASDLQSLKGMPVQVIIDGTEPQSGQFAVEHIASRAQAFVQQAVTRQLQSQGLDLTTLTPIDLRIQSWFNPDMKSRNAVIPGLISMVLGMPALSVALALAREREHGTLEQLMATPIGRAELMLGKMLPYVLVGLVNVILIPAFAVAWFKVPFNGNFLLFFGLSAFFLFSILSMGIVIGVFMRTQAAALALSFLLIFYPGFFLTGIFFPLASMPEAVRLEALSLPGTHYAIITRGLFLPGVGLDVLWPYLVMMTFLGVAFTGVAAMFFRKKLG